MRGSQRPRDILNELTRPMSNSMCSMPYRRIAGIKRNDHNCAPHRTDNIRNRVCAVLGHASCLLELFVIRFIESVGSARLVWSGVVRERLASLLRPSPRHV